MAKATNVKLDIQSGTTRTVYATWTWNKTKTENYKVKWYYGTGDGVWFVGQDATEEYKQSTYTAPENAIKVKFKVKPVSQKTKTGGKEKSVWTADWSTEKILVFREEVLEVPPVPTVTLEDLKLIARVDNLEPNCKKVEFEVAKNDDYNITLPKKKITVDKRAAIMSVAVSSGSEYKVRCRAIRDTIESAWTEYSSVVKTQPAAPEKIIECRALSSTSVYLSWKKSKTADNYEIQYTTKKSHFDSSSDVQTITTDNAEVSHREIEGLETGHTYFFRVRSSNGNGTSGWTAIKSCTIGREPSPPTTWSSKTTAKIGDELELYWVHNAEDGSNQIKAQVEIDVGDGKPVTHIVYKGVSTSSTTDGKYLYYNVSWVGNAADLNYGDVLVVDLSESKSSDKQAYIKFNTYVPGGEAMVVITSYNCSWDDGTRLTLAYMSPGFNIIHQTEAPVDDENDATFVYNIDTRKYTDGTKIKWRVATQGILDDWSEWSAQRTVDLYSSPSVELQCSDVLSSYPYLITASVGPNTQKPIGYHLSITALSSYPTVNEVGQTSYVTEGTEVFSKYFATSDNPLNVILLPGNVRLENNIPYKITCTVSTNTGLSTINDADFTVYLEDSDMIIDAEIGVDLNDLSAVIRPYCTDERGNEIVNDDVLFSIYRREYDGTFTDIARNVHQSVNQIDLHPALDYARYRIVATSQSTGRLEYYDVPGEPVGETAAVIQWDEAWHPFDTTEESSLEQPVTTSTMIKLPYNLDVTNSNAIDVSHVKYIGRRHPVSYYGTHVGESSTWNVDVVKDDVDTLYALRCLQKWMGDVYVREPSGSGYWATVAVSFSKKHKELTIPVTINITRVEGGA